MTYQLQTRKIGTDTWMIYGEYRSNQVKRIKQDIRDIKQREYSEEVVRTVNIKTNPELAVRT